MGAVDLSLGGLSFCLLSFDLYTYGLTEFDTCVYFLARESRAKSRTTYDYISWVSVRLG